MLLNTRVRTKLLAIALAPVAAVLALAALAAILVPQIAVDGVDDKRVTAVRDFTVQISPNSLSLLEIHAQLQQLARTPPGSQNRRGVRARIEQLRLRYEGAYRHWRAGLTDLKTRTYLDTSHAAAEQYLDLYRSELLPAQDRGDAGRVAEVLDGPMAAAFQDHRAALASALSVAQARVGGQQAAITGRVQRAELFLLVIAMIIILAGAVLAVGTAWSVSGRIRRLRAIATVDLPALVGRAERAAAGRQLPPIHPTVVTGRDELADAAIELEAVVRAAVELAASRSRLRTSTVELFLNLGRRNHKLLSRTLTYISELERDERDPDTLQTLFALDHLLTRMRRNAESMLVLAGSAPLRTWSRPVPIAEVLRAALSEIESFDRVEVTSLHPVGVSGIAVADLAHLLAELLENATMFSQPQTRVRVMGRLGADSESAGGYTLMVADDGWGMNRQTMAEANAYLASAGNDEVVVDARMLGFGVVGRLAARHRIRVSLAEQPAGGVIAWLALPAQLIAPSYTEDPATEAAVQARALSVARGERDPAAGRRAGLGALSRPFVVEPPPGPLERDDPLLPSYPPAPPTPPFQPLPVWEPVHQEHDEQSDEQPEPFAYRLGPPEAPGYPAEGYPAERDQPAAYQPWPEQDQPAAHWPWPTDDPLAPAYPPATPRPAYQPLTAEDYPQAHDPRSEPTPQPESWENPQVAPSSTGLSRRVRGAQLPDTGPREDGRQQLPTGVVPQAPPARNAESVRDSLARFSAGRRDAEESSE